MVGVGELALGDPCIAVLRVVAVGLAVAGRVEECEALPQAGQMDHQQAQDMSETNPSTPSVSW